MNSFRNYVYKNDLGFKKKNGNTKNYRIYNLEEKIKLMKIEINKLEKDEDDLNYVLLDFYIKSLNEYKNLLVDGYSDEDIKDEYLKFLIEGKKMFFKRFID